MSAATAPSVTLEFDGERFVPGAGVEIAYDHWLRYHLAARLAAGKRVLDVASGEGYGAAMLSRVAASVTAFDASERAVRHAQGAYADRRNLTFECAPLEAFFGRAAPASYDLVTAFEIIEHVTEPLQRELLAGIRRVLAPGGIALVSTPDKRVYTDARRSKNPFHVREMYRREFDALVREFFPHVRLLDQTSCTGSAIFEQGARHGELTRAAWTDLIKLQGSCEPGLDAEGEYLVAVVSDAPIPDGAVEAAVILDAAKKLVGEELYSTAVALDAVRRSEQELRGELTRARAELERLSGEEDVAVLRQRLAAMEEVAERFAQAAARSQEEATRAQRLEAELAATRHALEHLRQMVGVRVALKARQALEHAPRLKRAVGVVKRIL